MPDCVIHVLNGPNLNLLGAREPEIYGSETLADIESGLRSLDSAAGVDITFRQSNSEGELVGWIQDMMNSLTPTGLIINPAAFTHTSVAIRDALAAAAVPFVEVHLSNVHARESFRHHSYLSPLALGVICGLGSDGYRMAFEALVKRLKNAT